jgi:hypothetical protein
MTDILISALILAVAGAIGVVVYLARERRLRPRTVRALAALCGLGLVAMIVSDWPAEVLASFWAGHSILAGILSTVLLVGVVFLVFEDAEQRQQETLDAGLTGAGLGGIVDHVVDAEVALGLLSRPTPPDDPGWGGWDSDSKPLRWLRNERVRLYRQAVGPGSKDPRVHPVALPDGEHSTWRGVLVDQAVRRLLVAIRDWSPVIGVSKNGVQALLAISELRKDLMALNVLLSEEQDPSAALAMLTSLRQRLRILAHFFEAQSGASPCRQEVLLTFHPLPIPTGEVRWAADTQGGKLFSPDWQRDLDRSVRELSQESADVG